ncbi:MAG: hypothetical protein J5744_07860 [Oscillospiraceae bacterium]|nr:hypothetical protein [Oscillospiraceae bacterium]
MGNVIRLSADAPENRRMSISNQGTDVFLDLLIGAAGRLEMTPSQEELAGFLKERKEINAVSPGAAGFDLDEMPWAEETLDEDAQFLIRVSQEAKSAEALAALPYGIRENIVFPWLDRFAEMLKDYKDGIRVEKEETATQKEAKEGGDYYCRFISNSVRFGEGYRWNGMRTQYFAFFGYPNRNDDYFITSEISKEEYHRIESEYPVTVEADRDTAEIFRNRYVDGHRVLLEGWNRLIERDDPWD